MNKLCNNDIRKFAKDNNVPLWRIAQALGINDGNFSRKLRNELPTEKKEEIFDIINQIKNESEVNTE
jgi:hypothetical protein